MRRVVRPSTADYFRQARSRLDPRLDAEERGALDLQAAEAAFREGRLDEAFYACSAANLVAPSARSCFLMARIRFGRREYAEATTEVSRILALTPSAPGPKSLLRLQALCRLRAGDAWGAVRDLRESGTDVFCDRASRDLLHGDVLAAIGRWKKAKRVFVSARATDREPLAIARLVEFWAACPVDAFRDGRKALRYAESLRRRRAIGEARLCDLLAAAHAELGDWPEAYAFARRAVRLSKPIDRPLRRDRTERYGRGEPLRLRAVDGSNS